jgi:hypothetical protein
MTDAETLATQIDQGDFSMSDLQRAAELLRQQAADIANLHTVMMAAAVEISEHWEAHCDSEGYGPANLVRRLENGFPEQYGYDAQTIVRMQKQLDEQAAEIERLTKRTEGNTNGRCNYLRFNLHGDMVMGGDANSVVGCIEVHSLIEKLQAEIDNIKLVEFPRRLGKVTKHVIAERDKLRTLISKLHTAKGRYHTQLAVCDLFDAVGLKNERPAND